jgi:hypothetical protein
MLKSQIDRQMVKHMCVNIGWQEYIIYKAPLKFINVRNPDIGHIVLESLE